MRTKHLFATLVVAVVAAASLGVAVALNAPEVADRTIPSTGGDAGPVPLASVVRCRSSSSRSSLAPDHLPVLPAFRRTCSSAYLMPLPL